MNDIVATTWTPAMTTELLELLNVLGRYVELGATTGRSAKSHPHGPLVTIDELTTAEVLPVTRRARSVPTSQREDDLLSGH